MSSYIELFQNALNVLIFGSSINGQATTYTPDPRVTLLHQRWLRNAIWLPNVLRGILAAHPEHIKPLLNTQGSIKFLKLALLQTVQSIQASQNTVSQPNWSDDLKGLGILQFIESTQAIKAVNALNALSSFKSPQGFNNLKSWQYLSTIKDADELDFSALAVQLADDAEALLTILVNNPLIPEMSDQINALYTNNNSNQSVASRLNGYWLQISKPLQEALPYLKKQIDFIALCDQVIMRDLQLNRPHHNPVVVQLSQLLAADQITLPHALEAVDACLLHVVNNSLRESYQLAAVTWCAKYKNSLLLHAVVHNSSIIECHRDLSNRLADIRSTRVSNMIFSLLTILNKTENEAVWNDFFKARGNLVKQHQICVQHPRLLEWSNVIIQQAKDTIESYIIRVMRKKPRITVENVIELRCDYAKVLYYKGQSNSLFEALLKEPDFQDNGLAICALVATQTTNNYDDFYKKLGEVHDGFQFSEQWSVIHTSEQEDVIQKGKNVLHYYQQMTDNNQIIKNIQASIATSTTPATLMEMEEVELVDNWGDDDDDEAVLVNQNSSYTNSGRQYIDNWWGDDDTDDEADNETDDQAVVVIQNSSYTKGKNRK